MPDSSEIAIIIPVFNEEDTIATVLRDIDNSLEEPAVVYLIADSVSDPTIAAAESMMSTLGIQVEVLVQVDGRGPALAIKHGIRSSTEKFVIFMTADDSDDARDIPILVRELRGGAAVVCASRYAKGGEHIGGPRFKHLLSRQAGQIIHHVKGISTCDATNLFKAVTRDFLESITIESKFGFTLGLELVAKANTSSYSIVEIPTIWHERTVGESGFKVLKWLPTYTYWFMRLILSK